MSTKRIPSEAFKALAPGEPPLLERRPDGAMRFTKGHKKRGGRPPGGKNRLTKDAQELMRQLVQYGLEHGESWLAATAKRSPAKALMALARLAEYAIPKLQSVRLDGPGGGPVVVELVTLNGVPPSPPAQESAVTRPPDEE